MVKGCHSVLLHKKDTFKQCKIHINVNREIFICAMILAPLLFIGPESDHWLYLSLTHQLTHSLTDSLTNCRLVNLIDVILACEDGNSKFVEVVTVVDVDDEDQFITGRG